MSRHLHVRNVTRDAPLGDRVALADRFWSRLKGLLGRSGLAAGEGLLIEPSRGVHMYGMRFPLDVLLLDRKRRVRAGFPGLAPGQATGLRKGVRYALELPIGTIARSETREGDVLDWEVV